MLRLKSDFESVDFLQRQPSMTETLLAEWLET